MLTIDKACEAGVGRTRTCFMHPSESGRCIKIMKPNTLFDVNQTEYEYYNHMASKSVDMTYLPACYGFVDTNLGKGLVFDFIGDGRTLEKSLAEGDVSKEEALRMLGFLEAYLLKNNISYMDTKLSNLVVLNKALYIIDGLVPVRPRFFKIYGYIKFATTLKTRDKIRKACKRVINFTPP